MTDATTFTTSREQTFGEKAVGLSFNPSADDAVHKCKAAFAVAIDQVNDLRTYAKDHFTAASPEIIRMCSVAITEAQTAQMWAVKAITWRG